MDGTRPRPTDAVRAHTSHAARQSHSCTSRPSASQQAIVLTACGASSCSRSSCLASRVACLRVASHRALNEPRYWDWPDRMCGFDCHVYVK
eukprot:6697801-Prymnesium_polylepis.1